MKRLVALLALVAILMTMFSFTTSAMAATKPSVTLKSSKNFKTWEYDNYKLKYQLKSNSYKKKNGYMRAYFYSHIFDSETDERVDVAGGYFTGNINLTMNYGWQYSGMYYNLFGTKYRSSGSSAWRMASVKYSEITVR